MPNFLVIPEVVEMLDKLLGYPELMKKLDTFCKRGLLTQRECDRYKEMITSKDKEIIELGLTYAKLFLKNNTRIKRFWRSIKKMFYDQRQKVLNRGTEEVTRNRIQDV